MKPYIDDVLHMIQRIETLKEHRIECLEMFDDAIADYMIAIINNHPEDTVAVITRQTSAIYMLYVNMNQEIQRLSYIYN